MIALPAAPAPFLVNAIISTLVFLVGLWGQIVHDTTCLVLTMTGVGAATIMHRRVAFGFTTGDAPMPVVVQALLWLYRMIIIFMMGRSTRLLIVGLLVDARYTRGDPISPMIPLFALAVPLIMYHGCWYAIDYALSHPKKPRKDD